ncbi:MAG: acetyl-CoA C-acyltransferase [Gammaproteobacteria bacterium]|nr:acetyl-CoA C-acyltransferase [Gammaproteobacteria bacterium]NIR84585.1 acetyl-CoA C-acyltransferase [Gammaproteobacteria bacterium]NIR90488.1 acetyl-CoA C-acyltransferase [Gammaproteobacteria bacterium]NIU05636.1 acetyl-CoA C-acyltransferase [Gammaproteobacteria bacterium]NIV52775.1 acetyl-CoA C-acyltransferase [Gammaproteobacteria bacterium]
MNNHSKTRVAVLGGARTPFARAGTLFKDRSALQLAAHSIEGLLAKHPFDPETAVLAYGIVIVDPRTPHFAREVVFRSPLPSSVRAVTVTDNCITSLSAMEHVHGALVAGRADAGIAGGVECMSNPPLLFGETASRIFRDAGLARSGAERIRCLGRLRPRHFKPQPPAITEPSTGLTMGEHCEIMVKEWRIPRETQDAVAHRSQVNAGAATDDGRLPAEIHPLDGLERDPIIRADTTLERLAQLRPAFDRSALGTITAGNSSPLTDGAAAVLLMSEARARREGREPLAFIKAFEFAGIDPAEGLLMGPALAVPRLLRKTGLSLANMDIVEMHEAFAGQVACNLRAWEQGWKEPAIGGVPEERLNPLGSSIAVGHPFAATGARIVTTLANEMQRRDARYGLVSICGAGATAGALILERT